MDAIYCGAEKQIKLEHVSIWNGLLTSTMKNDFN